MSISRWMDKKAVVHIHNGVLLSRWTMDYSLPGSSVHGIPQTINKQGSNIQPWCTPFPILNQSIVPCPVLTVPSSPAYRCFRRQVRWSAIPFSLRISHSLLWSTVKGISIVIETEVDVFWNSLAFSDPADGNYWAHTPLSPCSTAREVTAVKSPPTTTGESPCTAAKTECSQR